MVFSSLLFVFVFLPIVLALYYLVNEKYKNVLLLIASLIFYAYGERKFVVIMMFSIVVNYFCAYYIDKLKKAIYKKIVLIFSIVFNLLLLYIFKYLDFSICMANQVFAFNMPTIGIHLPIGISFFTFQALSYVVDVYRGDVKVQRNLLNVGLYIALFPQLVAGPIVRYTAIEKQFDNRKMDIEAIGLGCKRFMLGFFKKILMANNVAIVSDKAIELLGMGNLSVGMAWLGAVCFSLQIFFDFSGYSDMAIGLGRMFGFEFDENFNYPYIAKSVTEFWRRWHISLSSWFRDYVYIPLGGSRVTTSRHILNLFIVWFLTGFWHGADVAFILWGLIYFVFLVIEKKVIYPEKLTNKLLQELWRIVTLLVIIFAWVMFNVANVKDGIEYWMVMLGINRTTQWIDTSVIHVIQNYGIFIIAGLIFSTPIIKHFSDKFSKIDKISDIKETIVLVLYVLGFIWSVSYLVLGAHNPFIYFNF